MPDGLALAETGCTSVQPYLSAASKVAPKAERVPRNAAGISFSQVKVAAADQRHVGRDAAEGVGLVHEAGGQNAQHGFLLPERSSRAIA